MTEIKKPSANLIPIANELRRRYKDFCHFNRKNPLDELLFILCSVKRGEKVYLKAFKSLKQTYPTFRKLSKASEKDLARRICWGGLQNQKAQSLKKITAIIIKKFGKLSLAPLHEMAEVECEEFLCSLPGVGKKIARCVMLYSLDKDVFPVDTHCWRISKRLGWITTISTANFCSSKLMDEIQNMIPKRLRLSLHANMVSLGRDTCKAALPRCGRCVIKKYCPKIM